MGPLSELVAPHDCLIVGGGPAGLTCAVFLARFRRPVLVIDDCRPRNYASQGIHGFLGQHGIKPAELLLKGRLEAEASGARFVDATALRLGRRGDLFSLSTAAGDFLGRRVVLAYGVRDVLPDLPGFEGYYGKSIFHCPDCDGYEVTGKRVAVVGWGKKAAGLTLELRLWTDRLAVFSDGHDPELGRGERVKLEAAGIPVFPAKVVSLEGSQGKLEGIVLATGERWPAEALFFTLGRVRSATLAEEVGCSIDREREVIEVDACRETSVRGVYAVGDLIAGSQLAVTAAADGAIAAIAINKSLLPADCLV